MTETNSSNSYCQSAQTLLNPSSWSYDKAIIGRDNDDADPADLALCVPGSRLVRTGFVLSTASGNPMLFVNAGGEAPVEKGDLSIQVLPDRFFHDGDVLRTDESITEGGSLPWIYQSA